MKCCLYARVSTGAQVDRQLSIPAQLAAMREHARREGWTIVEEFLEPGVSGRTADRPEFKRLLARCRDSDPKIDIVIVHKLDRLARSLADHVAIRGYLARLKVRVVSVTENIDDSISGQLIEHIMASLAEFYSANLAEEVKKGMRQVVVQGGWPHQPPRGYQLVQKDGRSRVVIHPEQGPLVRQAFDLVLTGYTGLRELRLQLMRIGLRTRMGKPLSNSQVVKLLTNPFYAGRLQWKGEVHRGLHVPLVPPELFDRVQEILKSRHRKMKRHRVRFLLAALARCSSCSALLTAEKHGAYGYYRCTGTTRLTDRRRAPFVRIDRAHTQLETIYQQLILPAWLKRRILKSVTGDLVENLEDRRRSHRAIRAELAALEGREAHLADLFVEGLISEESHRAALRRLAREREERLRRLTASESGDRPIASLRNAIEKAKSAWELHMAMPLAQQRQLVELVFADIRLSREGIQSYRLRDGLKCDAA